MYVCIHTHTHTHTHTYIYIYTLTHTHTYTFFSISNIFLFCYFNMNCPHPSFTQNIGPVNHISNYIFLTNGYTEHFQERPHDILLDSLISILTGCNNVKFNHSISTYRHRTQKAQNCLETMKLKIFQIFSEQHVQ